MTQRLAIAAVSAVLALIVFGLILAIRAADDHDTGVASGPCAECIVLSHIVALGSASDPELPGDLASVTRDSRGNYYVAVSAISQPIFQYDSSGAFLRMIGRPGEGPGEFRRAQEVKVWGDTVHVFDVALGRLSMFTRDGDLVGDRPFPYGTDGVVRVGDYHVVYSRMQSDDGQGMPLHLVGSDRTLMASFGASEPGVSPDDRYSAYRFIAPSGDTAVWATFVNRYELTLWSLSGDPLRTIERQPSWFPRWYVAAGREDIERPRPRLECVRDDGAGNVITLLHVPREDWKSSGAGEAGAHPPLLADYERADYSDTIIEVIRVSDGQLLATRRINDYLSCYLSNGQNLYTSKRADDFGAALHVWTVDFTPGPTDPAEDARVDR